MYEMLANVHRINFPLLQSIKRAPIKHKMNFHGIYELFATVYKFNLTGVYTKDGGLPLQRKKDLA